MNNYKEEMLELVTRILEETSSLEIGIEEGMQDEEIEGCIDDITSYIYKMKEILEDKHGI